jgi:hypothetical protein
MAEEGSELRRDIAAAIDGNQSSEPSPSITGAASLPGHADESPRTYFTMFVAFLWGVLALGFGLEAVVHFNGWLATRSTQEAGIAGVDVILGLFLGMVAVSLWLRKDWLPQRVTSAAIAVSTNPTVWVAVALVVLIISARPMTTPPISADDIARSVVAALQGINTAAPKTDRVEFVKNQGVGREYTGNPGEQPAIVYQATYAQTGTRLRAFVEYQGMGMSPLVPSNRVALGETKDFVKNGHWTLPVISRDKDSNGRFVFWWGPKGKEHGQFYFSNLQSRIVIVGDDGKEQHYYFLITDGVINDFTYPDVISAQYLDFASKWEAGDAR